MQSHCLSRLVPCTCRCYIGGNGVESLAFNGRSINVGMHKLMDCLEGAVGNYYFYLTCRRAVMCRIRCFSIVFSGPLIKQSVSKEFHRMKWGRLQNCQSVHSLYIVQQNFTSTLYTTVPEKVRKGSFAQLQPQFKG